MQVDDMSFYRPDRCWNIRLHFAVISPRAAMNLTAVLPTSAIQGFVELYDISPESFIFPASHLRATSQDALLTSPAFSAANTQRWCILVPSTLTLIRYPPGKPDVLYTNEPKVSLADHEKSQPVRPPVTKASTTKMAPMV